MTKGNRPLSGINRGPISYFTLSWNKYFSWHTLKISWHTFKISWHTLKISWHTLKISWHALKISWQGTFHDTKQRILKYVMKFHVMKFWKCVMKFSKCVMKICFMTQKICFMTQKPVCFMTRGNRPLSTISLYRKIICHLHRFGRKHTSCRGSLYRSQ